MAIKNWDTRKFKKAILDQVERNAEPTGVFLQNSARGRLYAIQEPDWGQAYRRKILGKMVVHEIERKQNEVVLTLGVLANPGLVGYVVGHSRHMGFYIETGSRRFPAQPYLRPTVFGRNSGRIVKMLTAGIGT